MPSLRELKKRLASTETAGELAGAMRTVAAAKLSRLGSIREAYSPYASALSSAVKNAGVPEAPSEKEASEAHSFEAPRALLLLSGSRGLCGGYNHELFGFFESAALRKTPEALVFSCGAKAREHLAAKGIRSAGDFPVSDVPTFSEARAISDKLSELYDSGVISGADIVLRRFENMLRHPFEIRSFLPEDEGEADPAGAEGEDLLFVPDRTTVASSLKPLALAASMYEALLSCASGVQAATLLAMRSAYDSAGESKAKLELEINRLRQAAVTASVLETSSDTFE